MFINFTESEFLTNSMIITLLTMEKLLLKLSSKSSRSNYISVSCPFLGHFQTFFTKNMSFKCDMNLYKFKWMNHEWN